MSNSDAYRRKAEELLKWAATTANMAERSKLIDQAVYWHNRAIDAIDEDRPSPHGNSGGKTGPDHAAAG